MATKPGIAPSADAETAEEEAAVIQPSNFETIYLFCAVVFLVLAILILMYAAGQKYGVGFFAK